MLAKLSFLTLFIFCSTAVLTPPFAFKLGYYSWSLD